MKKLFASALVMGLFTFGCVTDRCPDVPHFFDIQDVMVQNSLTNEGIDENQGNQFPDSIQFGHFAIRASYQVIYHAAATPKTFSLVPQAYALSCVEPGEGGTKEKIGKVEIIALSDFNAGFKSGDTLNAIVKINGLPVEEFIARQNNNSIDSYGFEITLTQKPDPTVKHAFKVIFKLTNGETYTPETQPVTIY